MPVIFTARIHVVGDEAYIITYRADVLSIDWSARRYSSRSASSWGESCRCTSAGMMDVSLARMLSISSLAMTTEFSLSIPRRIELAPSARMIPCKTFPFLVITEYGAKRRAKVAFGKTIDSNKSRRDRLRPTVDRSGPANPLKCLERLVLFYQRGLTVTPRGRRHGAVRSFASENFR